MLTNHVSGLRANARICQAGYSQVEAGVDLTDTARMSLPVSFRDIVLSALERDGRSARAVSLAAGLGPDAIRDLTRRENASTSIENALALCAELKIPPSTLVGGEDFTKLLEIYRRLPPDAQRGLLAFSEGLISSSED